MSSCCYCSIISLACLVVNTSSILHDNSTSSFLELASIKYTLLCLYCSQSRTTQKDRLSGSSGTKPHSFINWIKKTSHISLNIVFISVFSSCASAVTMTEFWLISAPGEKTCQQTWDKMMAATTRTNNLSTNHKFSIPDLKVSAGSIPFHIFQTAHSHNFVIIWYLGTSHGCSSSLARFSFLHY